MDNIIYYICLQSEKHVFVKPRELRNFILLHPCFPCSLLYCTWWSWWQKNLCFLCSSPRAKEKEKKGKRFKNLLLIDYFLKYACYSPPVVIILIQPKEVKSSISSKMVMTSPDIFNTLYLYKQGSYGWVPFFII